MRVLVSHKKLQVDCRLLFIDCEVSVYKQPFRPAPNLALQVFATGKNDMRSLNKSSKNLANMRRRTGNGIIVKLDIQVEDFLLLMQLVTDLMVTDIRF